MKKAKRKKIQEADEWIKRFGNIRMFWAATSAEDYFNEFRSIEPLQDPIDRLAKDITEKKNKIISDKLQGLSGDVVWDVKDNMETVYCDGRRVVTFITKPPKLKSIDGVVISVTVEYF